MKMQKSMQQLTKKIQQDTLDWQTKIQSSVAKSTGYDATQNHQTQEQSTKPKPASVKTSFLSQTLVTGAALALIVFVGYKYGNLYSK